jgi:hypothetical protein
MIITSDSDGSYGMPVTGRPGVVARVEAYFGKQRNSKQRNRMEMGC